MRISFTFFSILFFAFSLISFGQTGGSNTSIRTNAGGSDEVHEGYTFLADAYYTDGNVYINALAQVSALYQTERSARSKEFSYNIPLSNGEYTVKLHFAEIYWGATGGGTGAVGKRIFDVSLEGTTVLDDFDIFAEVGSETALVKEFTTTITDGSLDLYFDALGTDGVDQPKVSAIEILSVDEPAQRPFVTTWKTDNPGVSENNQITIPTYSGETYDYTIDWGDGTSSENVTGDVTHAYITPGIYSISISGEFPGIVFGSIQYGADTDGRKLMSVDQWGDISWRRMDSAYDGCDNMDVKAVDSPELHLIHSLERMFNGCFSLEGTNAFQNWEVGTVQDMSEMFSSAIHFNQPLEAWDVSNVTDMLGMFGNSGFDQNIGSWDVSKVENMSHMFTTTGFNQDLSNWDVRNVTNMSGMFSAGFFNHDIGGWDVSKVENMSYMFQGLEFNQDLSNWDVGNVTNMEGMFQSCPNFNQDLSQWNIAQVSNMREMFDFSGLSDENYDKILIGWTQLPSLQSEVQLDAPQNHYCEAKEARQQLIDNYGWTINDAGEAEGCDVTPDISLHINVGGDEQEHGGTIFVSDTHYVGGNAYTNLQAQVPELYKTERSSPSKEFSYSVPVVNGEYMVKLHFAEIYWGATGGGAGGVGKRVFDVTLEGTTVLDDFDIFAEVGAETVVVKEFTTIIADGSLDLYFDALGSDGVDQPKVSAIEILSIREPEPRPFVMTWETDAESSGNNQIIIPTHPDEAYNYTVDWGDGAISENVTGDAFHTYATPGTYTVSISGEFPRIYLAQSYTNRHKIRTIEQWGDIGWTSMAGAFDSCSNLDVVATDVPDLSLVTSLSRMFAFCHSLMGNESFENWDVSTVEVMYAMFSNSSFDQDLSNWNVSAVTDMGFMFYGSGDRGISTENYDKTLIGWSQLPLLQNGVRLDVGNFYCTSETARQSIIDTYGWTINDEGFACILEGPTITTTNSIRFLENETGIVLNVESTDTKDSEGVGLIYKLTGHIDDDLFDIDANTGEVRFKTSPDFNSPSDVGTDNLYNIRVTVTDSDGFSDRQDITIEVIKDDGSNLDSDFDGVLDEFDDCPNTPVGQVVDEHGCEFVDIIYQWIEENASKWFGGDNRTGFGPRNVGTGQSIFMETDVSMESFSVKFQSAFGLDFSQSNGNAVELILQVRNADGLILTTVTNQLSSNFLGGWARFSFETPLELAGNQVYYFTWYLKNGLINDYHTGSFGDSTSSFELGNGLSSQIEEGENDSDFDDFNQWRNHPWDFLFKMTGSKLDDRPFITTWKTDNFGASADNQITIPTHPDETYNYTVDWGDGTSSENVTGNIIHTYATAGTYQVSISGEFPRIYFDGTGRDDAPKIIEINQWGNNEWSSMGSAFAGCNSLDVVADDVPDLSRVVDMSWMFSNCAGLIGNETFNLWDVSTVTNMSNVFSSSIFNRDISDWDVSQVRDMSHMFENSQFNQDISGWNVSNVQNMAYMFVNSVAFSQGIGSWDVGNVTNMKGMFFMTVFNEDIGGWDVSNVIDMSEMFSECGFNQDLSLWDISNVESMGGMFDQTYSAFGPSRLSDENYNKTLMGWSQLPTLKNGVQLDAPQNEYCEAKEARQQLIDTYDWTINDAGEAEDCGVTPDVALYINAGGAEQAHGGKTYVADMHYSGGGAYANAQAQVPELYKTERSSWSKEFSYSVPVANGEYTVRLHFAEIYWGATGGGAGSVGKRVFDVALEDSTVLDDFDIFAEVGAETVVIKEFTTTITDGIVDLYFDALGVDGVDQPKVSAIEILSIGEPAPRPFVTTWKTDNSGVSGDNQITIPTYSEETYDYIIDWGDGTVSENVNGNITHTYEASGTYTVSISGEFPGIVFGRTRHGAETDGRKLMSIEQWGDISWRLMDSAYDGCENMDVKAMDSPDLSLVHSMERMFNECLSLVGTTAFQNWKVESIRDMSEMFSATISFNQPLSTWDVQNVVDMNHMFGLSSFDQNISSWNVSKVENMSYMFHTTGFNKDISSWDVSNVVNMSGMFSFSGFNQDISSWNVTEVQDMSHMFQVSGFNQDLSNWDVGKVKSMRGMFISAGVSDNNYNKILMGWSKLPSLQNGIQLDAPQNEYCEAKEARRYIIDTYGWTINDAGEAADCQDPLSITGFVLINADTNEDIIEIADGSQIDLDALGTTNLNIRATTGDGVESVRMVLSGAENRTQTESVAPYALFGDISGNYIAHEFVGGAYQLTATAYAGDGATGDRGMAQDISFSMVGDGISGRSWNGKQQMVVYPNEASTYATVDFAQPVKIIGIMVYDLAGRIVGSYDPDEVEYNGSYEVDVRTMGAGTYILNMIDDTGGVHKKKLVVKH